MVMTLKKDVTIDEVNMALKQASEEELKGVMAYTNEPLVSSDIIGEPYSSIVDGLSTMVIGNRSRNVKVLSWYDNEWSFACRLVDLIKFIGSKI
jgi:glyceraldehyde 3-phosphate dehydrogenase